MWQVDTVPEEEYADTSRRGEGAVDLLVPIVEITLAENLESEAERVASIGKRSDAIAPPSKSFFFGKM